MLDDGADGGIIWIEFLSEIPGGLQVDDVVVGKFLALKLAALATPTPEPSEYMAAFWCGFSP